MAIFNQSTDALEDRFSRPLNHAELLQRAENAIVMDKEFKMLPNPMPKITEDDDEDDQIRDEADPDKNRYANIIPNPATRVKLKGKVAAEDEAQCDPIVVMTHEMNFLSTT